MLLLKIKYVEFEYRPKLFKTCGNVKDFSYSQTDKKFLPRIGKDEH